MADLAQNQPAEWLAHRYDPQADTVHFIHAPRALRREKPFLIDEHLPSHRDPVVVRRADAIGPARALPTHFIFHSAYCCSTLLANAYDREGVSVSLKEPLILNDLVGWRHRGGEPQRVGAVLNDALTLLARPIDGEGAVVIKPSNLVNALAPTMLAMRPQARAVLLYAPLEAYLGSIALKGMWGRLWVRELLAKQLRDGLIDLGFAGDDYLRHTDLQAAAVGWLAQHALFTRIMAAMPGRVMMLNSETLVADPLAALTTIDALFGFPDDSSARDAVIARDFARNAKSGERFDGAARRAAQRDAANLHAEELEKVAGWARAVAANAGLALPQ